MPSPKLSIIIVGAGVAGLSTAIALRRNGNDVTVLERHASCQALGAPLRLHPNGTRVLIEYGMEDVMSRRDLGAGNKTSFNRYSDGKVLMSSTSSRSREVYGAP